MQSRGLRLLTLTLLTSATFLTGCDGGDELRDLDRGRDQPPAIKDGPPEEGS